MIERIRTRARERLEQLARSDDAHNYFHSERVANLAGAIREHEGGDALIISAASYMHDWCSCKGREYHVSEPALSEIRNELVALQFPRGKLEAVIDAVRHHEAYDFHGKEQPLSQECLILQDADRLDAIGAIGIARCFYTSPLLGCLLGTPDDMHDLNERYSVGQLTPAIQHFYTKLLYLKDAMNTGYAKQIAQERHDFMVRFLERFKLEWYGEI